MTLFSDNDAAVSREDIVRLISENFGEQVVSFEKGTGGANSTVCVVDSGSGDRYLVKKYRNYSTIDNRSRLVTEFEGLSFLWNNGVRLVPQPLRYDLNKNIGVYQYVSGRKLKPGEISSRHLSMVADFVGELVSIGQAPGAKKQPLATEACLSLQSYVDVVQNRLNKLLAMPGDDELVVQLRSYLEELFTPLFFRAKDIFSKQASQLSIAPCAELPDDKRILSPSDFGFHNIIITDDGRMVFIDFEYYGWDDPAQLIADFFLQPAVPVPREQRGFFLGKLGSLVANDSELTERLPVAYLFSSLKWCLLLLNCFLQNDLTTRLSKKELFIKQLEFSQKKMKRLEDELAGEVFPLGTLQDY